MPLVRPELRRRARLIPHPPVELGMTRWLATHGQTLFPIPRREGVELIRRGRTLIFKPRNPKGALLWLHGGGHIIGHPSQDGPLCVNTAAEVGVTVPPRCASGCTTNAARFLAPSGFSAP